MVFKTDKRENCSLSYVERQIRCWNILPRYFFEHNSCFVGRGKEAKILATTSLVRLVNSMWSFARLASWFQWSYNVSFVLSCLYLVVNIINSIMSTTRFIWPVKICDQKENIFFVGEIQVQVGLYNMLCVVIRKRTSFIKWSGIFANLNTVYVMKLEASY